MLLLIAPCPQVGMCSNVVLSTSVGMKAVPWLPLMLSKIPSSPKTSPKLPTRIHPSRPPCCDMCQCQNHQSSDQDLWGTDWKSDTRGHSYPSCHTFKLALCVDPSHSRRVTTLLRMFMSSVALTSMSCRKVWDGSGWLKGVWVYHERG